MRTPQPWMHGYDLASQLASHPQWVWREGMQTMCGLRLLEDGGPFLIGYRSGPTSEGGGFPEEEISPLHMPNLRDPPTVAMMLRLLRQKEPCAYTLHFGGVWRVLVAWGLQVDPSPPHEPKWLSDGCLLAEHKDEGSALALALLHVWGKT